MRVARILFLLVILWQASEICSADTKPSLQQLIKGGGDVDESDSPTDDASGFIKKLRTLLTQLGKVGFYKDEFYKAFLTSAKMFEATCRGESIMAALESQELKFMRKSYQITDGSLKRLETSVENMRLVTQLAAVTSILDTVSRRINTVYEALFLTNELPMAENLSCKQLPFIKHYRKYYKNAGFNFWDLLAHDGQANNIFLFDVLTVYREAVKCNQQYLYAIYGMIGIELSKAMLVEHVHGLYLSKSSTEENNLNVKFKKEWNQRWETVKKRFDTMESYCEDNVLIYENAASMGRLLRSWFPVMEFLVIVHQPATHPFEPRIPLDSNYSYIPFNTQFSREVDVHVFVQTNYTKKFVYDQLYNRSRRNVDRELRVQETTLTSFPQFTQLVDSSTDKKRAKLFIGGLNWKKFNVTGILRVKRRSKTITYYAKLFPQQIVHIAKWSSKPVVWSTTPFTHEKICYSEIAKKMKYGHLCDFLIRF